MYSTQGTTHTGLVRSHNEDRFIINMITDNYGYLLVCDGMGGEKGGSIASTLACEEIRRILDSSYRDGLDEKSVYMIIETAIANANTIVHRRAEDGELRGMGTTASLAVLLGDTCYLANVGDSRAYLLHENTLRRLTVDHTHVQTLIDSGEITEEEAKTHPKRHYLTRAVGVAPSVTPFYSQLTLVAGDLLLLCSDGLYGMIPESQLAVLLGRVAAGEDCQLLVDEANHLGGQDNITAVAAIVTGGAVHG